MVSKEFICLLQTLILIIGEMSIIRQYFLAEVNFLNQKELLRIAVFAGDMKFDTQISSLLN